MNIPRRTALKNMAAIPGIPFIASCATNKTARKPPNILFIMTDDQTVEQMGCASHPFLKTPNMDRLANEGARFENCFCTNSLCAPSRASVLTGCYSNINGITGNSEKKGAEERLNPDLPTFPQILKSYGYRTGLIGKYHLRHDPVGFDDWRILPGQGAYLDPEFIENGTVTQNSGYVTDITTNKALDFLETTDPDTPFCLIYQHKGPHRPFMPAPRHAQLWNDVEFPYPASFDDDYSTRKIAGLARDMKIEVSLESDYDDLPEGLSDAEKKRWIYQRFAKDMARACVSIDENLGRVLDFLDERGIAEDTLVIYTSDNGFFVGEHGWYDKRFMYEPSLRIPLLIRYPRLGFSGTVPNEMALNVDFAVTILDIAGIPVPGHMHGKSLRPLLEGTTPSDWRKSVYYSYYEDSWRAYRDFDVSNLNDQTYTKYFTTHRVGPHHGVRTERWKLIEYYTEDGYRELFDLKNDPHELHNIYGKKDTESVTQELLEELERQRKLYGPDDTV